MLNARIRKRWRAGNSRSALIGEKADLTYPYDYLGAGPETLADLVAGKHSFAEVLQGGRAAADHRRRRRAGAAGRRRGRGAGGQGRASSSARSRTAGTASACCTPRPRASARSISASCRARAGSNAAQMASAGALDVSFLLGADEIDVAPGAFVVYIGTHGDRGAHRADVILPGAAYPEKSGALRQHRRPRADGQPRRLPARRCARGLGDPARAVGRARPASCPTTRSAQLRAGAVRGASASARIDQIAAGDAADIAQARRRSAARRTRRRSRSAIDDFYLTNPIARASAVMAECSALAEGRGRHDGGGVGPWTRNLLDDYLWPLHRHRGGDACCCWSCC